jgi:hypothetical protein
MYVNSVFIAYPDPVRRIFKDAGYKISSYGTGVVVIVQKIDRPDAVIHGKAIVRTDPHKTMVVLQKMIRNVLNKPILYVEMFEIVIPVNWLGC